MIGIEALTLTRQQIDRLAGFQEVIERLNENGTPGMMIAQPIIEQEILLVAVLTNSEAKQVINLLTSFNR